MSTQRANDPNSLFHSDDANRDPNRIRPLNFFPDSQSTRPDGDASLGPPFDYVASSTNNAAQAPVNHEDRATPPAVPDHITIGLTNSDNEMTFKVRRAIKMKRIMDQYAERSGRSRPALRFLLDGTRIQDEDTPEGLEMEDGDSIEVHQEQIGGYRRMLNSSIAHDDNATQPSVTPLTISLNHHYGNLTFKVKPTIKMKRVMDEFAARKGWSRPALRFLLEGQSVHDNDTPESLRMEDGNSIDVHMEHTADLTRMLKGKLSFSVKNGVNERFYKIAPTTKMKFVMDEYAEHSGISRAALRFSIEKAWIGRIQDNDTPEILDMADGDVVKVHHEQLGGLSSMLGNLVVE